MPRFDEFMLGLGEKIWREGELISSFLFLIFFFFFLDDRWLGNVTLIVSIVSCFVRNFPSAHKIEDRWSHVTISVSATACFENKYCDSASTSSPLFFCSLRDRLIVIEFSPDEYLSITLERKITNYVENNVEFLTKNLCLFLSDTRNFPILIILSVLKNEFNIYFFNWY